MASGARSPLLPAARRLVVLLGAAILVVGGVAALVGLALGGPALRSAATGLYLVGCFLIVLGVFNGLRGPVRPKGADDEREAVGGILGFGIFSGGIRAASADERADARATTWLFLVLGIGMIVVGVLLDPRTDLL
jgi:uncharacterized membrane protein HdeD (DUF308 family)